MLLLVQLDTSDAMGLPFPAGSHFSLLMCPTHDGALLHETGHLGYLPPGSGDTWRLPEAFWNDQPMWHVHAQLLRAGSDMKVHRDDGVLVAKSLSFEPFEERTEPYEDTGFIRGEQGFKVGGEPFWYQAARRFVCPCGSPMAFLMHLPPHLEFQTHQGDARLFALGNATHFFACVAMCHPRAVWAVHDS